jgi:hypothetical protein
MAAFKIKKEPTKIVEVRMKSKGQLSMPIYIQLHYYDMGLVRVKCVLKDCFLDVGQEQSMIRLKSRGSSIQMRNKLIHQEMNSTKLVQILQPPVFLICTADSRNYVTFLSQLKYLELS